MQMEAYLVESTLVNGIIREEVEKGNYIEFKTSKIHGNIVGYIVPYFHCPTYNTCWLNDVPFIKWLYMSFFN